MTPVFLLEHLGQVGLVKERKGPYELPGRAPSLSFGLGKGPHIDMVTGIFGYRDTCAFLGILVHFFGFCLLCTSHMRSLV